jgi:hypothetical protein
MCNIKIYWPVKEQQGDERHITRGRYLKFINPLQLSWYGHDKRMKNQKMPK